MSRRHLRSPVGEPADTQDLIVGRRGGRRRPPDQPASWGADASPRTSRSSSCSGEHLVLYEVKLATRARRFKVGFQRTIRAGARRASSSHARSTELSQTSYAHAPQLVPRAKSAGSVSRIHAAGEATSCRAARMAKIRCSGIERSERTAHRTRAVIWRRDERNRRGLST